MSRGGWRPWRNTAERDRLRARLAAADSGELSWGRYFDGEGGGYIFPCGDDRRNKVIVSEPFADAQAEADPEAEL